MNNDNMLLYERQIKVFGLILVLD